MLTVDIDDFLRVVDFSKSFQTYNRAASYMEAIELPDNVPRLTNPLWWSSSSTALEYSFGRMMWGNTSLYTKRPIRGENQKWVYDTQAKEWSQQEWSIDWPEDSLRLASEQYAYIPSIKKGYMFSGLLNEETDQGIWEYGEHNGMLVYDQETNSWKNESIISPVAEGTIIPLKTATDEVLIQFGGRNHQLSELVRSLDIVRKLLYALD
jgi:hypothetical protein